MNDGVSGPPRISSRLPGLGPRASGEIDRDKHERIDADTKGQKQQSQSSELESAIEEISLSMPAIRALINEELPTEVQEALAQFADLGDLRGAEILCDRIDQKGLAHIQWPRNLTLRQALENAAS